METPDAQLVFGAVDIGGTKLAVGLVSADGCLLSFAEVPTEPGLGPENAFRRISSLLEERLGQTRGKLQAIGIGCTGPVDPRSGTIGDVALLEGWCDFPLVTRFEQHFAVPACLENDCDAAALGEAAFGVGRNCSRFLYVSISTGIGAGLILDGQIYRGAAGVHPELGHHSIDPSGPPCYCGSVGCWESLASGTAIASWYQSQSTTTHCSCAQIFRCAAEHETLALRAVDRFTHYLGVGLGNLITLFAPDCIALGGGVMASAHHFLDPAATLAQSRAGLIPQRQSLIQLASLGRQAGLIGAAYAAQLHIQAFEGRP